ncbi:hypothetical protein GCM10010317_064490 [Streptomyces mirabilis]|nr:hypothetical protein GCM10010317_064490 [Streptomyces mirabilis]
MEEGRRAAEPVRSKISQELGEVAEALHGALGVNPRRAPRPGGVSKELALNWWSWVSRQVSDAP